MSDLAATNCGNNGCGCGRSGGCGSNIIWIILLLSCFNNDNDFNLFDDNGCGCDGGCGRGNNNCLLWILLLSCCGNCF